MTVGELKQVKNETKTVGSCAYCHVNFINEDQLSQHLLYHKSPEFFNYWLNLEKELPNFDPHDPNLKEIEISEPSEFYKYRPSKENSAPRIHKIQWDWELSWEDWNATAEKPVWEKEILPTCDVCGLEFLHENTLKIHKKRPNCLEPKLAPEKRAAERVKMPYPEKYKSKKRQLRETLENYPDPFSSDDDSDDNPANEDADLDDVDDDEEAFLSKFKISTLSITGCIALAFKLALLRISIASY